MKRLMQAMLAVALVLVTAFTFYVDTASAQPVSAPVPASCSPEGCLPQQVCTLPPRGNCTFVRTGQLVEVSMTNTGNSVAQLLLTWGDQTRQVSVDRGQTYRELLTTNRANLLVFNLSSDCTFQVSIRNVVSDPKK